ncbi:hypothetical protein Leryth_018837 [Lithospermum erythrorhizon]|nr:hypothetical protein Leryth_018837 [Lithospermum erythrorhizon]
MVPLFSTSEAISSVSYAHNSTHEDFKNSEGDIYTPTNKTFSTILQSSIHNLLVPTISSLRPTAILTPSDASQIHVLQIRVRSGGHDYEGLSYTFSSTFQYKYHSSPCSLAGKSRLALLSRTPYGFYTKGKSDFVEQPITEYGKGFKTVIYHL